jgi:hypothetical protein
MERNVFVKKVSEARENLSALFNDKKMTLHHHKNANFHNLKEIRGGSKS